MFSLNSYFDLFSVFISLFLNFIMQEFFVTTTDLYTWFLFSGLIRDNTGKYVNSFHMLGCILKIGTSYQNERAIYNQISYGSFYGWGNVIFFCRPLSHNQYSCLAYKAKSLKNLVYTTRSHHSYSKDGP